MRPEEGERQVEEREDPEEDSGVYGAPETYHPGRFPKAEEKKKVSTCEVEVICLAANEKSLQVVLLENYDHDESYIEDEHKHWILKTDIDGSSEVEEKGDQGILIISEKLAEKKGLL